MFDVQGDEAALADHELDLRYAEFELLEDCTHLRLSDYPCFALLVPQLIQQTESVLADDCLDFLKHEGLFLLLERSVLRDELSEAVAEKIKFYRGPGFGLLLLFIIFSEDVAEYFFDKLDVKEERVDFQVLGYLFLGDGGTFVVKELLLDG